MNVTVNRNPTVRQRRLARTLREIRTGAGRTIAQAAGTLACAESKISRIESGQSGIRLVDLRLLLDAYGVDDESVRLRLEELSRGGRQRGWWNRYAQDLNPMYADYIALEADASEFLSVQPFLIPGLLQTERYTRAVVKAQMPDVTDDQVDTLTKIRQERRSVLTRPDPLTVWVVLSEWVLGQEIGGQAVMQEQFAYVIDMAGEPNISLQILPKTSEAHAALFGPFVILTFPDPAETDVVYVDGMVSTIYIEEPDEVMKYSALARRVVADAHPYKKSLALIKSAANGMGSK
ncbi:helix-turn-helix domain-containing protein [Embleya hyalina]|uniref:helix-turn-helix domain-containing protein n=1 Tax=Embleya hyalina TaxID=516124 RepID=UPI001357E45B|nr:helix-turn-helix transcriptional regulator [Embleya hyalina]